MNVLFVSHVKDSSLANGGAVFSSSLIKLIKAAFADAEITELYCICANSSLSRIFRKSAALTRSLFSSQPSKSLYFRTAAFASALRSEFANKAYDLIVIDHAEMLWCIGCVPETVPIVHISHNIEHLLYEQYVAKYAVWPGFGPLLAKDARKYGCFETEKAHQVKNLVTISCEDMKFWRSLSKDMNVLALNPAFDYKRAKQNGKVPGKDKSILGFLGNMEWWPNRDAVTWLMRNVLPHLTINYELHLFGKASELFGNGKNVIGHGFVDDIGEVWKMVDTMVNPIVTGAGVNVKVAEAIYNNMPMVCTSQAVRGLQLVPDRTVAIVDTPEQWIDFLNSGESLKELVSCRDFPNANRFSFAGQTRMLQDYLGRVMT